MPTAVFKSRKSKDIDKKGKIFWESRKSLQLRENETILEEQTNLQEEIKMIDVLYS